MSRYFHRTTREAADAILNGGFKDGRGHYLTDHEWSGVWISNTPLDENAGVTALLGVDIDDEPVAPYEWVQGPSLGYREFLVPAALLNRRAKVQEVQEPDEFDPDAYPRRVAELDALLDQKRLE